MVPVLEMLKSVLVAVPPVVEAMAKRVVGEPAPLVEVATTVRRAYGVVVPPTPTASVNTAPPVPVIRNFIIAELVCPSRKVPVPVPLLRRRSPMKLLKLLKRFAEPSSVASSTLLRVIEELESPRNPASFEMVEPPTFTWEAE
jgi:hypothetical protein